MKRGDYQKDNLPKKPRCISKLTKLANQLIITNKQQGFLKMLKDDVNLSKTLKQSNADNESIIYSPNCLQVPNNLCEYWMSKLTPAEFKVIMCIYMKCFAWFSGEKSISLSQIEEMTGLSKKGIINNLKSLVNYGLIKRKQYNSDNEIVNYEVCFTNLKIRK